MSIKDFYQINCTKQFLVHDYLNTKSSNIFAFLSRKNGDIILNQDTEAYEMERSMFSQRSAAWAPVDEDLPVRSNSPHMCYGLCGDSGSCYLKIILHENSGFLFQLFI